MIFSKKSAILILDDFMKGDFVMGCNNKLTAHIGYHSAITLTAGERVYMCSPGDLHLLTVKNVKRIIRLLDCGAVSHTGMIRQKGHTMESAVITIQNLPAIRLEEGTVTSEDVRNIQSAKARFVSAVYALLRKADVEPGEAEVTIETIDGTLELADAIRIGLVPAVMKQGSHVEIDERPDAERVSLDEPAIIHAFTDNLFFPKK